MLVKIIKCTDVESPEKEKWKHLNNNIARLTLGDYGQISGINTSNVARTTKVKKVAIVGDRIWVITTNTVYEMELCR